MASKLSLLAAPPPEMAILGEVCELNRRARERPDGIGREGRTGNAVVTMASLTR